MVKEASSITWRRQQRYTGQQRNRGTQGTLWKIMESYGIPRKLVKMVKTMYAGNQSAVVHSSGQTDLFTVASGVKQGCNMSGFLFLLVIDWIIKATVAGNITGNRWKMCSKLDDFMGLCIADDIALISSTRDQIQQKVRMLRRPNFSG